MKTKIDLTFERCVLNSIGKIWTSDLDVRLGTQAMRTIAPRADEVPAIARKHKVPSIVQANLERLVNVPEACDAASKLKTILASEDTYARAHRDLLATELNLILDEADRSGLSSDRFTIIKGFCNARFYPSTYDRWMRDIDVLCPTWEDGIALLEVLLAIGYRYDPHESPWVKADVDRGREMYGQIFLLRDVGGDVARVDIHYGTYSIGFAGYLETPYEEMTRTVVLNGRSLNVMSPEGCILIAQSHALSDGYVSAKDTNDLISLALSNESIDWHFLERELDRHHLRPQAACLARHVFDASNNADVKRFAENLLAAAGHARSRWQTHNRDWTLRSLVNSWHAWSWTRSRHGIRRGFLSATQCFLFYIRRLDLAVRTRKPFEAVLRKLMPEPNLRDWKLRPDACTLLIDASVVSELAENETHGGNAEASWQPVADGVEYAQIGGFDFVRLHGRVFVPTLDLLISPSQADAVPHD